MQKLNGREYYVVVMTGIMALFQSVLLLSELFSASSPFVTSEDGQFVNVQRGYIINLATTFLQIIFNITAFILLLRKNKAGWIIAFSTITFYTFLFCYLLGKAALVGYVDSIFYIGCVFAAMLLLAIIFLLIPSTLKKFNITKKSFIPVFIFWAILCVIYFVLPD